MKKFFSVVLIAVILFGMTFVGSVHSAPVSPSAVSESDGVSMVPSITWNRTYGGINSGSVVIQTADGGFLLGSATVPF